MDLIEESLREVTPHPVRGRCTVCEWMLRREADLAKDDMAGAEVIKTAVARSGAAAVYRALVRNFPDELPGLTTFRTHIREHA